MLSECFQQSYETEMTGSYVTYNKFTVFWKKNLIILYLAKELGCRHYKKVWGYEKI